jgi:hypothetical protein
MSSLKISIVVALALFLAPVSIASAKAGHHNAGADPWCRIAAPGGLGGNFEISGGGYAADTSYPLELDQPPGPLGTSAYTDAAGNFVIDSQYALYSGVFTVTVFSPNGRAKVLATCSTIVP